MTIQKNVASQRLHFLMVDSTDFATPETGINTTNQYCKDNGGWSTCSNAESEISSGLYRITLAQTETNAAVVTYKFSGAGCATQYMTFYPEDGYAASVSSILADTKSILSTLDGPILSTMDGPLLSTLDMIASTIDGPVISTMDGPLLSTLDKIDSTIDGPIHSTLDGPITNYLTSIVDDSSKILSTLDDPITDYLASILEDTGTTIPGTISDVISTLDGPIHSTLDKIDSTIDGPVISTMDGPLLSTLDKIDSTIDGPIHSTLDGPITNYLTSIVDDSSKILSTLDDPITDYLSSILADTGTTLENRTISIVDLVSDILSTLDDPVITTIGNKVTSILADTGTTLPAAVSDVISTLDGPVESALSDLQSAVGVLPTAAEINAEVVDALGTDTIAEMAQGAPPATPTFKQAVMYLYMAWRNQTLRTSNLWSICNDAGTTICKATISDDGTTFTKAEFITGA